MTKYLGVIFGLVLFSIPAMAQIYNGMDKEVKAPFDKAVAEANVLYANEAIPGAYEDVKPRAVRYKEMTNAVDQANKRHFNMVEHE